MSANDLIFSLRESGFSINAENSRLQIAPAKNLTNELKETIRQNKIEILTELQQEIRQQRVLTMLEAAPENQRAIYTDAESDPNNVILTIAVRHIAIAEMLIPKAKYDPFLLLSLVDNAGGIH